MRFLMRQQIIICAKQIIKINTCLLLIQNYCHPLVSNICIQTGFLNHFDPIEAVSQGASSLIVKALR